MASTFLSQYVSQVGPPPPAPAVQGTLIYGPVVAGQVAIVFGLSGTNLLNTPVTATFFVRRGTVNTNLIYQGVVPVGSSLVVAGSDQKVVLQAGDALYAVASGTASLDVACSLLVQS